MIKTKTADKSYENDVLVSNLSKNYSKVVEDYLMSIENK